VRKAKLLTCPKCHKGGFLNLKAHRCNLAPAKAKRVNVDLLPPPDEATLSECATNIARLYAVIGARTRAFHDEVIYHYVEVGLYFLKVKEALGHGDFMEFLSQNGNVSNLGIIDRTARNYMNAARNAGLTHESTEESIDALRARQALHGKKATDLYRLTDGDQEQDQEQEQESKWDLMREVAIATREQLEQLIEHRRGMNKKVYETVAARLHRTIEEFTGTGWVMTEDRKPGESQPFFKEHGDVYELGS
jgi:hypothetical protein